MTSAIILRMENAFVQTTKVSWIANCYPTNVVTGFTIPSHSTEASADFKDINKFRQLCERVWSKKYGYLVIDKSKPDLDQKYGFNLN